MLPILEKEKGWENGVFTSIFFSTLTLIYKWKEHQLFFFSIWINGWSINQSSVEYQQKSLIIAISNTVESKLALRRPWQDYRQTKHAMEQVRCNAVAGFLRRPRYTISLKLCHPLSLVIVGTCNSFAGAV